MTDVHAAIDAAFAAAAGAIEAATQPVAAGALRVQRLVPEAVLPVRAHADDAGADLVSVERCVLAPGERALVGTGIAIEVPHGWTALVCARSGLAARHGIGVVNGPGVIDAGYRGEVRVVLHNTDARESFTVEPGDRIAQLVVTPVHLGTFVEVETLSDAARDAGGFGSTGGFTGTESDVRSRPGDAREDDTP